jgi:hypothetical protein
LLAAAAAVATATRRPVVHLPARHASPAGWRHRAIPWLALAAAVVHAAALPWRSALSPLGQSVFMLWFAVPALVLAWGRGAASQRPRCRVFERLRRLAHAVTARPHPGRLLPLAVVIGAWACWRLVTAWHSPRAADIVDMWRVFGRLAQLSANGGNFLTEAVDPEVPGLTAIIFFFQGLPLLQIAAWPPGLSWVQVLNTGWLALSAVLVAVLAAAVVGRSVAVIAAAAFLFSPFVLLFQLNPMPAIPLPIPAAVGILLIARFSGGSPAALVLMAAITGLAAGIPPMVPTTGLALLLAIWRSRSSPRAAPLVKVIAALSLVTGLAVSLPSPQTIAQMFGRYAATEIPLAVAEPAVYGQFSPTIDDWLGAPLPADIPLQELAHYSMPVTRGWLLVPISAVLAPFAISRWPLRLWGDALFEPFSAALAAFGLAVCLRHVRDRASLILMLFFAAALVPAFTSSYDRASILRLFAAPVPVAILAAAGSRALLRAIPRRTVRGAAIIGTVITIGISGTVLFDVVNVGILPASSLGLLARALFGPDLDNAGLLTSSGRDSRPGVPPGRRYWELDWLRHNHPYIDEIARCVPKRPIPLFDLDLLEQWNPAGPEKRLVFWSPALQQTTAVSQRLCRRWPEATLYTVRDSTGLSRLYGARLVGDEWMPGVPREQWTTTRCQDTPAM